MRDEVLPVVKRKGGKMFFVGVGTAAAAREFALQLGIDPALCFGDEDGEAGDALGLAQGFKTMWNPPAVDKMMGRNDEASLKAIGESFKGAVDAIGFKKLAPSKVADTLRQGGTFIYRGSKPLLEHFDSKVGDNAEIDAILSALF